LKLQGLNRKEIQILFKKGHSLSNGFFAMKYLKHSEFKHCITFAKSLKLNKPQKNKLKRQIKQVLQEAKIHKLDFHIVIILLKLDKDKHLPNQSLISSIESLMSELTN